MKFSKAFSKVARGDGRLFYRRVQNLMFPVTLNRVTASLARYPEDARLSYTLSLDGAEVAKDTASAKSPFVADLGIRLRRGERTFVFSAEGFEPHQLVEGTIEIDFGLF